MGRFLRSLVFFMIPGFIFLVLYILEDPFKIIHRYDNYYAKNDFVSLNRSVINAKTYIKNYETVNYNAFIFGSSRTIAVKTADWLKHLPHDARPFHWDANAEGLFGVINKLKFIDKNSDSIKYVIIFLDQMLLENTSNSKGHLYAEYPAISDEGWLKFHSLFIRAFSNPKFILGYFYYKYTGQYKTFMGSKILDLKYPNIWNPISSDLYLGLDKEIENDSIGYYSRLEYMRDLKQSAQPLEIKSSDAQIRFLAEIKEVFDKHNTDYRIVSNPFISEFQLGKFQKELLDSIFGSDYVFDFSGKSRFSAQIDNFYDPSHFRTKVATEILSEVYSK
jgi:hypothetical protein